MLVVSHARWIFTHRLRIHRLHRIRKFDRHRPRRRSCRQRQFASSLWVFIILSQCLGGTSSRPRVLDFGGFLLVPRYSEIRFVVSSTKKDKG